MGGALAICEVSKEYEGVAGLGGIVRRLLSLLWGCTTACLLEFALVILGCCFHFLTKALHLNTYR